MRAEDRSLALDFALAGSCLGGTGRIGVSRSPSSPASLKLLLNTCREGCRAEGDSVSGEGRVAVVRLRCT